MVIADEFPYGFANSESSASIFAAKVDPSELFGFLSEHIHTCAYIPEALGKSVKLLPDTTITYIYQTQLSDWTVAAPYYSRYFSSPDKQTLLPLGSACLNQVAVVLLDETEDYSSYTHYKDGCLIEGIILNSIKYKGYEDFQYSSKLEQFARENDIDIEPIYYFHYIQAQNNIDRLIKSRSSASDLTFDFMKRENIYVPMFNLTRQPIINGEVVIQFDDAPNDLFKSFGLFYIK